MSILIKSYSFVKETFESNYLITIDSLQDTNINFNLKLPTNPILDNMIINMNEEPLLVVVNKLQNLILQDEFGYTSRIELLKYLTWLGKIQSLSSQNYAQL